MSATNSDRKKWAKVALEAFSKETHMQGEDNETKACDLIANLMHLLGPESFDAALNVARMHYEEEIEEEKFE